MNPEGQRSVAVERAFWAAAALAIAGGVGPLLAAAGHTNRIGAVVFPFAVAAVAMVALGIFYRHGKALSALVYFVAGLAVAYGLLLILAVPLRLAVEGTCPPAPQRCAAGFELQLTPGESTGLTIAVAFGVFSLLAGFIGLAMIYRRHAPAVPVPVWPDHPPAKTETPPVGEPALESSLTEPAEEVAPEAPSD